MEPYWPGLYAKSLEGLNPKDLITNVGGSVGTAGVTSGAPAAGKKFVYNFPRLY